MKHRNKVFILFVLLANSDKRLRQTAEKLAALDRSLLHCIDGELLAEGTDTNGDASPAEIAAAGLVAAMRRGSTDSVDDDTSSEDDITAAETGRHPQNRKAFAAVESDSKGTHRGSEKVETDLTKRCKENWECARTDGIQNLGEQYFAEADGFPVAGQPAISVHLLQEMKRHLGVIGSDTLTDLHLKRLETTVLNPGRYALCAEVNSTTHGTVAAPSAWLMTVTGSETPYSMKYERVIQPYHVFRGIFALQVPADMLDRYLRTDLLLRELMLSVLTNGCKLQVICIGSMFPHKFCGQYSGAPTISEGIEEDVPLAAAEKWAGAAWFEKRLEHAYQIVANKIEQCYRQWTALGFGERAVSTSEHGCSGETMHSVLINSIGTAWVEKWLGQRQLAIERLQDVLLEWLQGRIKRTRGLKRKPARKHADLERMLRKDGGITGDDQFFIGETIQAEWCDKFGRIATYKCSRTWRKIVVAPGWHDGVITGAGPADWPGTWAIAFADGSKHDNTPASHIRRRESAPATEPARM